MAARPRRMEQVKPLCLTCWNADGVCSRKLELEHFLNQHGVDICLLSETFFNPGRAFGLPIMSATSQTDCGGWYSHPSPPWYSPTLSACSGTDPLGGYCHSSHIGRQTGENPCGLTFAFPPTDWRGPDRLFRCGISSLDGR